MKNLFVLFAAALLFAGCGNKQDAESESMETTRAEAEATEAAPAAVEEAAAEQAERRLQETEASEQEEIPGQDAAEKTGDADSDADQPKPPTRSPEATG